jgi:hypothetical protein
MAPNASASATKYCERYFIGFYSTWKNLVYRL